ncbi:MAG: MOSC domain-containing protein [Chitinophagaceae bacterium]|nr:MOSC domain-containing protein [Chitinophagaceae bacterium]
MLRVSELFIYPIKSLGGIALPSAKITDRGFQYDRRWMLVDSANRFLTQREFPQMALLQVQLSDGLLTVQHKTKNTEMAVVPALSGRIQLATVQVWGDTCRVELVNPELDEWFSDMLSISCKLVYMPDSSKRRVDTRYATNKELTSLSDGYPFLIIGQSSLDDLNARLAEPVPMNRFRPNIVFTGADPYLEDIMEHFSINSTQFYGVKPCARCVITTIDQDSAGRSREPLKTLAAYRQKRNNVYFGQNLLHDGEGEMHVGDEIKIHQLQNAKLKS